MLSLSPCLRPSFFTFTFHSLFFHFHLFAPAPFQLLLFGTFFSVESFYLQLLLCFVLALTLSLSNCAIWENGCFTFLWPHRHPFLQKFEKNIAPSSFSFPQLNIGSEIGKNIIRDHLQDWVFDAALFFLNNRISLINLPVSMSLMTHCDFYKCHRQLNRPY